VGGVAVAVAVLVVAALLWHDRAAAVIAVAGPLTALVLTEQILKPLVDRTGPNGANFFPSGHATGVAAIATVALLVLDRNAGRRWAVLALPVLGAWMTGVGVAMVQLHYHYLTDVLGGAAVGVATVLSAAATIPSRAPATPRFRDRDRHTPTGASNNVAVGRT
jgi:undecaprenyl-diphosphatase